MGIRKLTDDDIRAIYSEYMSGGVYKTDLARKYGVSHTMVCYIVNGRRYKDVVADLRAEERRKARNFRRMLRNRKNIK